MKDNSSFVIGLVVGIMLTSVVFLTVNGMIHDRTLKGLYYILRYGPPAPCVINSTSC